jgi:hypothetical protein
MLNGVRFWTLLAVLVLAATTVQRAQGACCRAACIGPVPWHACFADTTSCNTLQCAGGGATSLAVDAAGTCGQGILFASCPPTEVGACNDLINNDGWVDGVTDAADPDCQGQAPPPAAAPAVGPVAIGAILGILIALAAVRIRRGWQR